MKYKVKRRDGGLTFNCRMLSQSRHFNSILHIVCTHTDIVETAKKYGVLHLSQQQQLDLYAVAIDRNVTRLYGDWR